MRSFPFPNNEDFFFLKYEATKKDKEYSFPSSEKHKKIISRIEKSRSSLEGMSQTVKYPPFFTSQNNPKCFEMHKFFTEKRIIFSKLQYTMFMIYNELLSREEIQNFEKKNIKNGEFSKSDVFETSCSVYEILDVFKIFCSVLYIPQSQGILSGQSNDYVNELHTIYEDISKDCSELQSKCEKISKTFYNGRKFFQSPIPSYSFSHKFPSINNDSHSLIQNLITVKGNFSQVEKNFLTPIIVGCGIQSAGKSSLLNRLCQFNCFPIGSNGVTRFPLEITFIPSIDTQNVITLSLNFGNSTKIYNWNVKSDVKHGKNDDNDRANHTPHYLRDYDDDSTRKHTKNNVQSFSHDEIFDFINTKIRQAIDFFYIKLRNFHQNPNQEIFEEKLSVGIRGNIFHTKIKYIDLPGFIVGTSTRENHEAVIKIFHNYLKMLKDSLSVFVYVMNSEILPSNPGIELLKRLILRNKDVLLKRLVLVLSKIDSNYDSGANLIRKLFLSTENVSYLSRIKWYVTINPSKNGDLKQYYMSQGKKNGGNTYKSSSFRSGIDLDTCKWQKSYEVIDKYEEELIYEKILSQKKVRNNAFGKYDDVFNINNFEHFGISKIRNGIQSAFFDMMCEKNVEVILDNLSRVVSSEFSYYRNWFFYFLRGKGEYDVAEKKKQKKFLHDICTKKIIPYVAKYFTNYFNSGKYDMINVKNDFDEIRKVIKTLFEKKFTKIISQKFYHVKYNFFKHVIEDIILNDVIRAVNEKENEFLKIKKKYDEKLQNMLEEQKTSIIYYDKFIHDTKKDGFGEEREKEEIQKLIKKIGEVFVSYKKRISEVVEKLYVTHIKNHINSQFFITEISKSLKSIFKEVKKEGEEEEEEGVIGDGGGVGILNKLEEKDDVKEEREKKYNLGKRYEKIFMLFNKLCRNSNIKIEGLYKMYDTAYSNYVSKCRTKEEDKMYCWNCFNSVNNSHKNSMQCNHILCIKCFEVSKKSTYKCKICGVKHTKMI